MEAVLYIAHGSRSRAGRDEAVSFIKKYMSRNETKIQEYGFLELASPTIEEAFERCISRGASHIKVIPLLLLTAGHAKKDIPQTLLKLKAKHHRVIVQYGRPIGVHEKMIDVLSERLYEQDKNISRSSTILLVGRGSSDPDVQRDLCQIAAMLEQRIAVTVNDCYLHGAGVPFPEALKAAAQSKTTEIYIIPYLLFTGRLMTTMQKTIAAVKEATNKRIVLCNGLGYHPNIESILEERINELSER